MLDCPTQTFESSIESLVYKIRNAQEWTDVAKIMSSRPDNVKQVIWSRLSNQEKNRFKTMKVNYEKEMNEIQEWLTEENLVLIAEYLSACQDIEMISSLCQIYKKPVIQAALDRISDDKRYQINPHLSLLPENNLGGLQYKAFTKKV